MIVTWFLIFAAVVEDGVCLNFVKGEKYNKNLQVETDNGFVQGFKKKIGNGKYAFIYKGIPFAKPPLYDLRFRSPQPYHNWSGVLDATLEPSSCVALMVRVPLGITTEGSEDCLYLNVYTPIGPNDSKIVPVIFWIYGGGFLEGNTAFYNPELFLEKELVVVLSNYRLGMFGFLTTEDEAIPGNYGLKDQNAALRWVQRNIRNFGGDPDRVTIMGQSAGGSSVMYHLISPKSRGLFHSAIAMSGSTLHPWSYQKFPKNVAAAVGLHLGISTKNTTTFVESLRKMDSKRLINGQILPILIHMLRFPQNGFPFTPVIECNHKDAFITESSYKLLEEGKFGRMPLIIGGTSGEFEAFFTEFSLIRAFLFVLDLSPSMMPTGLSISSFAQRRIVGNKIKRKYFKSQPFSSGTDEEYLSYLTDAYFTRPMQKCIELITKYIPVFSYVFDYQSDAGVNGLAINNISIRKMGHGAAHAVDQAFIWKNFQIDFNEKDQRVSRYLVKLLSNFVKYGNPTPKPDESLDNLTWPPATASNFSTYLHIGENLTVLQNFKSSNMKFWEEICNECCEKPLYSY